MEQAFYLRTALLHRKSQYVLWISEDTVIYLIHPQRLENQNKTSTDPKTSEMVSGA